MKKVIVYAGPKFGCLHLVIRRAGRILTVQPFEGGAPFQVHASDCEEIQDN